MTKIKTNNDSMIEKIISTNNGLLKGKQNLLHLVRNFLLSNKNNLIEPLAELRDKALLNDKKAFSNLLKYIKSAYSTIDISDDDIKDLKPSHLLRLHQFKAIEVKRVGGVFTFIFNQKFKDSKEVKTYLESLKKEKETKTDDVLTSVLIATIKKKFPKLTNDELESFVSLFNQELNKSKNLKSA